MRTLLALAGLVLLAGCNVVWSPKSRCSPPPTRPARLHLRPGVWLVFEQPGCKVDPNQPIDEWPDCAGGAVVKAGEIAGYNKKPAKGVWEHSPFVFAAGDPRIAQVQMKEKFGTGADSKVVSTLRLRGASGRRRPMPRAGSSR